MLKDKIDEHRSNTNGERIQNLQMELRREKEKLREYETEKGYSFKAFQNNILLEQENDQNKENIFH